MLRDKDSKQSIQVTIRVRPLSEKYLRHDVREQQQDSRTCVKVEPQNHSIQMTNGNDIKKFTFDSICQNDSQQDMFQKIGIKSTLNCLEGYNCTIFAYGQTGAGKTYTMMGVNPEHEQYFELRGLIPRTLEYLFQCIDSQREKNVNFIIKCSFLEIYNEQIIDLLNKNNTNLQLREDARKGVYVEGISEEGISTSYEALEILAKGSKSRHVGSTYYNESSSRSHSVFTMQIESKEARNGVVNTKNRHFHFIDLAGSERTKQIFGERLKEGCSINKALLNLGTVINSLSEMSEGKPKHVNYRDSKLTFLLKDSLGGNSKTHLIANISPSNIFYGESLSTLGFARRVKLIKREKASINEDSTGNLESMKNQIKRLKQEIITLKSNGFTNCEAKQSCLEQEQTGEITGMLRQYVSEEIDKQTKLQLQILNLSNRIVQLQDGIRQYNTNEVHLRLIIKVYEDKVNRLKQVECALSGKMDEMKSEDEESKKVIEYFKNQRELLKQEIEALKTGNNQSKYIKELLKAAKVFKEDTDDDSLHNVLLRNSEFLQNIKEKLEYLKPEKVDVEFTEEFQKKIEQLEVQFGKKEQEYHERIEQLNLELQELKNSSEQSQSLLKEAVNSQISMEERILNYRKDIEGLEQELRAEKFENKQLQKEKEQLVSQHNYVLNKEALRLQGKESQLQHLLHQIEQLKGKILQQQQNLRATEEDFCTLSAEKAQLQRQLVNKIEDMQMQKNEFVKYQLEVQLSREIISEIQAKCEQTDNEFIKIQDKLKREKKEAEIRMEEMAERLQTDRTKLQAENQKINEQISFYKQNIEEDNAKIRMMKDESDKLRQLCTQREEVFSQELSQKQDKILELVKLINAKEFNDSETAHQLNKLKLELINVRAERETTESRLNKMCKDLENRLEKEVATAKKMESFIHEINGQYNQLNQDYTAKKKELQEANESLLKERKKVSDAKVLQDMIDGKLSELTNENEQYRDREKQLRLQAIQLKNEIYTHRRNSEIQIETLKQLLETKELQVGNLEKELGQLKARHAKQVSELEQEINKSKELAETYEESLKKSTESLLLAKQRKVQEMKLTIDEKEKQLRDKCQEVQLEKEYSTKLNSQIAALSLQIKYKNEELIRLSEVIGQLQTEHLERIRHAEELGQQAELEHHEQLNKKDQRIEELMADKEDLLRKMEASLFEFSQLKIDSTAAAVAAEERIQRELKLHQKTVSHLEKKLSDKMEQFAQAGLAISKYKAQISELEGRLQEGSANEGEMTKMLKQNKAKQFQIQGLQQKLQAMATINNQFEKLSQENLSLRNSTQALHLELVDERAKNEKIENEISLIKQQWKTLNSVVQQLKVQYQIVLQRQSETTHQCLEMQQIIQKHEEVVQHANSDYELLASEKKMMGEQISRLLDEQAIRKKEEESNIQDLSNYIEELKREFRGEATNLKEDIQTLKEQNRVLHLSVVEMEKQLRQKQSLNKQLKQIISETNSQLEKQQQEMHQQMSALTKNKECIVNQSQQIRQEQEKTKQEQQRLRADCLSAKNEVSKLMSDLSKQRDVNANLKMIIHNSECQKGQLEIELQEKDTIYKKLLEKIARNENEQKKIGSNSEHYLKTIELLEKSRAEQLELKKQNEELKRTVVKLKEEAETSQNTTQEVKQKSEQYCLLMQKRMEQFQSSYFELQRGQQKLVKEKKSLQRASQENEQLREQIKTCKQNYSRAAQRIEQLENKCRTNNLEYIQLQKQSEEYKRGQANTVASDDKNNYINKIKSENATLKLQKSMLTDSLNKEKEEKLKLRAEMRLSKENNQQAQIKTELEKKNNEIKSLQEIVFEITTLLRVTVIDPKTRLDTVRSIVLSTIREKVNESNLLKARNRDLERQIDNLKLHSVPKETKAMSISNVRNARDVQNTSLYNEREKDTSLQVLNNRIRNKIANTQTAYSNLANLASKQQIEDIRGVANRARNL